LILNNTARYFGGGIYLGASNSYVTVTDTIVRGNTLAKASEVGIIVAGGGLLGGGILLTSENNHFSLINSTVSENTAQYGGGMYVSNTNSYISITGSTIKVRYHQISNPYI
jgi:hypothetical protein